MLTMINSALDILSKFPSLWPGSILAVLILAVNGVYNHNTFAENTDIELLQKSIKKVQFDQRVYFLNEEIRDIKREIFDLERVGKPTGMELQHLDDLRIELAERQNELKMILSPYEN